MADQRFSEWLTHQEGSGKRFTPEQKEWLTMIKEHIATSVSIGVDDFEYAPFYEKGGAVKVYQLVGQQLNGILDELNRLCPSYAGKLEPLRQPTPVERLDPSVNTIHVRNGFKDNNAVNKPGAEALVELLVGCCRDERYSSRGLNLIQDLSISESRIWQ
ncbi:MAG: type I restriction-modification enzyme R subunit C-terminal domain-containing protein [bacterium]